MLLFGVAGGRLSGLVKSGECFVPHAVEPSPQGTHSIRVEPVDPAGALGPGDDQAAVFEYPQLLGQLTDRARAPGQQLEDRPPGRVTEQTQTTISVSVHER